MRKTSLPRIKNLKPLLYKKNLPSPDNRARGGFQVLKAEKPPKRAWILAFWGAPAVRSTRGSLTAKDRTFMESLIDSVIHADGIFLRHAAPQKPRNSAAIPSVSFLAGRKNLLVIAKTS